ncbi:MAG: alcohol dehydrogenase catalytic domain-containing protein [Gemmatimonadota bacterium]
MKAAVLYSYEDLRVEDIGRPRCGPGEAIVRTMASGICSGDVMRWYIEKKAPLVIGHEPSGIIIEVGSGVTTAAISRSVTRSNTGVSGRRPSVSRAQSVRRLRTTA